MQERITPVNTPIYISQSLSRGANIPVYNYKEFKNEDGEYEVNYEDTNLEFEFAKSRELDIPGLFELLKQYINKEILETKNMKKRIQLSKIIEGINEWNLDESVVCLN